MATLEAQGFGLPVIGCRAGATPELVEDGINGHLVNPGDQAAVRRVITYLHRDRPALAKMSLAARRRFDTHPGWEDAMNRLTSFLEALVSP
jgi:glycosyltransferase involved in cell wall biosynthesis